MSENIATYTDATFDEQIGSSAVPVVVDFWAEWCGPCKMVAPILEEIAEEQAGSLAIAKLNVDDNPDIARRFGVMSIPTMIVFKDGQEAARIVGAKGKSQLLDDFKPFLEGAAIVDNCRHPSARTTKAPVSTGAFCLFRFESATGTKHAVCG